VEGHKQMRSTSKAIDYAIKALKEAKSDTEFDACAFNLIAAAARVNNAMKMNLKDKIEAKRIYEANVRRMNREDFGHD